MDAPAPIMVADVHAAAKLLSGLAAGPTERASVLYLDPKWKFLGRSDFTGGPREVKPPLRRIFAEALRLDAATLILAHNHPSGNTRPSHADVAFTRTVARVAETLDMVLADHLIITDGRYTSLRDAGLM